MSKVWLITGSSRGLGRALAEAVLASGQQVVATARQTEQLADLVATYGTQVCAVALDVTEPVTAAAAVKTAVAQFGRLDVVVNNAGYSNVASIEDVEFADFQAQMDTNFYGVVHVTRAALPVLREQGFGHFIQISTIGGRATAPGMGAYLSAKWAMEGFSEVVAAEVASVGVKVTIVEPGAFRTEATTRIVFDDVRPEYAASVGAVAGYFRSIAGQEPGDPAKAAQVILQLAEMEKPPLRLLLGSDAARLAAGVAIRSAKTDERWRELSLSTDFDPPR